MKVGKLDTAQRVFIVAEIGNNHEGDFGRAKEMVHRAVESGVDAVKFQTFKTEWFTSPTDPARIKRLKGFELTYDQFAELAELTKSLGAMFMSTPFELESARFLRTICDALKVASGDNDYWDLVRACAETDLPLIVSSGMSTLEELRKLVGFLRDVRPRSQSFALLHCVSAYPAPPEQANLRAIPLLAKELGCEVGYSDHTLGIEACTAAVALGARVIEKHFTLSHTLSDFRDHQLSADPGEMTELVKRIRLVEPLLGSGVKEVQPGEIEIARAARRSAAAARDLKKGHVIEKKDLVFLRPGTGIRAGHEDALIGKRLARDLAFGTLLSHEDMA